MVFILPYKDPEERKAYNKAYHAAHAEERKAYLAAHAEETKARAKAYFAAHPEVRKVIAQRRRARKAALPATLLAAEWQSIKTAYRNRCAYCGVKETKQKQLTQDHVIPVARGGGYVRENIVPACQSCNSSKHTKLPLKPVPLVLL